MSDQVTGKARCRTCNGHGLVGGFVNAENGYDAESCDDCEGTGMLLPDRLTVSQCPTSQYTKGWNDCRAYLLKAREAS